MHDDEEEVAAGALDVAGGVGLAVGVVEVARVVLAPAGGAEDEPPDPVDPEQNRW